MEKKTMTPSNTKPMTDGQIAKFTDVLKAKLQKIEFSAESAQIVLGDSDVINNIADTVVLNFRKYINYIDGAIIRDAQVDNTRIPQEVLEATGRRQSTSRHSENGDVVANMPRGEEREVIVHFIPFNSLPNKYKNSNSISDDNLENTLNALGYKSASPYAVAAVNESEPGLADKYPNCTHWKDKDGKWCFITFGREGQQDFDIGRRLGNWDVNWYFAAEKIAS